MERLYEHSLYFHLYTDGTIFLLPADQKRGSLSGVGRLRMELQRTRALHGIVLYSLDADLALDSSKSEKILSLLDNGGLTAQMVDPHPAVHGFHKSFAPYLGETLEVAEFDVEGLRGHLREARRLLQGLKRGSPEFRRQSEKCRKLAESLDQAKACVKRLSSLYFELCVRVEGAA